MKKGYYTIVFTIFAWTVFSQTEEVTPPEHIKTILFFGNTAESQLPVLRLGDGLKLSFDALNGNESDYYYTIEHYNFDWTPSNLAKTEYLIGIDNQRIRTYTNSITTYQTYSHYTLKIPNQFIRGLKVSGNYMIKIYDKSHNLAFSRKFMVYEPLANVGVSIKRARDVKNIQEKQLVDIIINSEKIQFTNPYQRVKTSIIQNNNLYTAITNLKPQYTIGNELIYRYTHESSFWAGNEYLFFENKDIRTANNAVRGIHLGDLYNTYLFTDTRRSDEVYTYNPDINGNFLITAIDAKNPHIEADYAWIHFSLQIEEQTDASIYVYGNFNNYHLTKTNKMVYNSKLGTYYLPILLKQGFYNYKYVVVNNDSELEEGAISGNFYQTENNYKVLVYYRDLGERYDRIIGFGEGSSINITN